MAGLVSMARAPEALEKDSAYGTIMPMADKPGQPVYPWGLCITLSDEEMKKLGIDDDCDVDDEFTFTVRAEVTSVSENKTTDGSKCRLELQIVAMKVIGGGGPDGDNDEDDRKETRYKKSR